MRPKDNQANAKMVQLSERTRIILKYLAEGHDIGDILTAHPELSHQDVKRAADEALRLDQFHRETSARKSGDTNLRTYEVWTGAEDDQLRQMVIDGVAIQEMSKRLQRHPMIIRRRITTLHLDVYLDQ